MGSVVIFIAKYASNVTSIIGHSADMDKMNIMSLCVDSVCEFNIVAVPN